MLAVLLGLLGLLALGFTVEELPYVLRQRRVKRERLQRERAAKGEAVAEGLRLLQQAESDGELSPGECSRLQRLGLAFREAGFTIDREPPPPPPPRERLM